MDSLYASDLTSKVLVDKILEAYVRKFKIVFGEDGFYTDVTDSVGFPVRVINPGTGGATSTLIFDSFGNSLYSTSGALNSYLIGSDPLQIYGTVTANAGTGNFTVVQGTNPWVTSRTWNLNSINDSVAAVQSGVWTTGRTWTSASATDSVTAVQGGPWTTDRTWVASSGSDSMAVVQGTSPWITSGTASITGPVTVLQGTSPWVTSRTWNTDSGTDSITSFQGGLWNVGRTWTAASATDSMTVYQGTNPWMVSGTFSASGGSFAVTQGTSPWVTSRTWVSASGTDSITVAQGTSPWLTSRNWTLGSGTDSVAAIQSGTWTTGRTWAAASGTDSITSVQGGIWTVQQGSAPWSVSQSGAWTTGRTWTSASATDSITAVQGTSPWITSGTASITGSVTVLQGTSPWVTSRTWLASSGTDSMTVVQGTNPWVTSRNWTLSSGTDSVAAVQSGAWTTGRTWLASSGTDSIAATQGGTWTVQQGSAPWSVSQSGTWTTGRTWLASSGTDSIAAIQGGTWTTGRTWTAASATDSITAFQGGTWTIQNISASNYGAASAALRTASQIGNTAGQADFNAGTTGAQTLRVVFPTDQTGINTFIDKTASGTLTAVASPAITLATNGMSTATIQLLGTFSATAIFEYSIDGGVTYNTLVGIYAGINLIPIGQLNSTGQVSFYVGSFTHIRTRLNVYTSGTVNVVINAGAGNITGIATQFVRLASSMGEYITSTLINSKQRLDVNLPTGGVTGSAVPFHAQYVGGRDLAGNLQPIAANIIDTGNSSTATLLAAATFTGTWQDVTNYSNASVFVFADQVSATDGLKIEYSTDGTNIDDNDLFTVPASNGQKISISLDLRYYRIRYTNGAVNQGAFRLQIKLHANRPKPSTQRLGTPVNSEQDAEVVMNTNGRMNLTGSAPATVSAGVASGTLIAANAARKGLVVINTSTLGTVSLHLNNGTAVLNSGITLYPRDVWYMDEWTFTTAQINVIASLAATSVSVQELIT